MPHQKLISSFLFLLLCINFCVAGNKKKLYVYDRKVECAGSFQCLQIKDKAKLPWQVYSDTIAGFNYEEGYNYKILVEVTTAKDAYAGTCNDKYRLVKIISKIKSNYNPAEKLVNKRWILKSMYDTKTTLTMQEDKAFVQFDIKDNKINGKGICNDFDGAVKTTGHSMSITGLMATKMLCKGIELEKVMIDFLSKTKSYTLEGDILTLTCADGSNLIFKTQGQ